MAFNKKSNLQHFIYLKLSEELTNIFFPMPLTVSLCIQT